MKMNVIYQTTDYLQNEPSYLHVMLKVRSGLIYCNQCVFVK